MIFKFKQFEILQEKSPMKIGTDGVLLGSYAHHPHPKKILDIGTGCGLMALMLAQRFESATITAIEIDELAAKEARYNFENSPFCERLMLLHADAKTYIPDSTFDLIVCNPPFFKPNDQVKKERALARSQIALDYETLVNLCAQWLSEEGLGFLILPEEAVEEVTAFIVKHHLYVAEYLKVRGNLEAPIKRRIIGFSTQKPSFQEKELIIEKSRHLYTDDYIKLTKDFYLNM